MKEIKFMLINDFCVNYLVVIMLYSKFIQADK